LFQYLEETELLNPLDEDLFALQYTFIPRINKSLSVFRSSWNNHGVRTENGRTPLQVFTAGLVALDFLDNVSEAFGSQSNIIASILLASYTAQKVAKYMIKFLLESNSYTESSLH